MLDSDLASLSDFAFRFTAHEFAVLKSQIVTSSLGHGGRRKLPLVFSEQVVAMLSSVLSSRRAVRVNIEMMRTFVRNRRLLATPGELVEHLSKLAETLQFHDTIARVLHQFREKPTEPAQKGRISFQSAPGTKA